MSTTCPKGHASTDSDYCSECGVRMTSSSASRAAAPTPEVSAAPAAGAEICPDCSTPRVGGARFCEVCRYDFAVAASGATPVTAPLPTVATPAPGPQPAPPVAAPPPVDISAPLPQALNLIVTTDPSLVEEPDPATPCPVGAPDRLFPLDLAENLVGRRSERKGIYPEVEISDPGVSHRHLKLIRESDGSFVALELGSANGTRLNGAPMIPGVPLPVKAGDEFVLGIWTRLTLRARG